MCMVCVAMCMCVSVCGWHNEKEWILASYLLPLAALFVCVTISTTHLVYASTAHNQMVRELSSS